MCHSKYFWFLLCYFFIIFGGEAVFFPRPFPVIQIDSDWPFPPGIRGNNCQASQGCSVLPGVPGLPGVQRGLTWVGPWPSPPQEEGSELVLSPRQPEQKPGCLRVPSKQQPEWERWREGMCSTEGTHSGEKQSALGLCEDSARGPTHGRVSASYQEPHRDLRFLHSARSLVSCALDCKPV